MQILPKKILLISLLLLLSMRLHAQKLLLGEYVDSTQYGSAHKWGPNDAHYITFFMAVGGAFGQEDKHLPVEKGIADIFTGGLGVYYKQKLDRIFSVGLLMEYRSYGYHLSQMPGYSITDSLFWGKDTEHKREKFYVNSLGLRGFLRINFDRHRGENIGNYLELGGGPDWNIIKGYQAVNIRADKVKVNTKFTHLPYIFDFPEYAYIKIGIHIFSVALEYRLTSFFKSQYHLPALPPYFLKLEIAGK